LLRLAKRKTQSEKRKTTNKNLKQYQLYKAKDKKKDQTYFLWQLGQKQLSRIIFPLGDYTKEQIKKILEREDGIYELEYNLCELNLDYIGDLEHELLHQVYEEFDLNSDYDDFFDKYVGYVCVDLNIKQLLRNTPDLTVLIKVYSNYDCCNSFDDPKEPETYLTEVFKRVKAGIKREDYEWEFYNGAYGGSLFCFVFKTDIESLIELKRNFKNSITIPKGTEFGFFSSFQGAGSVFEKRTYRNITLPKTEPSMTEHDCIDIIADIEQSHSIDDVYGDSSWISEQNITVT